jgi:nuclear pore complex protein Nup133
LSEAFELAENHFDYPSLVWLCYTTPAGQDANRQARVETYIERYGEDFAFVLYQWFIDNGQLSVSASLVLS